MVASPGMPDTIVTPINNPIKNMGGILIKPDQLEKWRLESKKAKTLLKMTPYNPKEAEIINNTAKVQKVKVISGMGLGLSLAISLRRYFPESRITNDKNLYFGALICVLLPSYVISVIYTNREVISQLQSIYDNHKILVQIKQSKENPNSNINS